METLVFISLIITWGLEETDDDREMPDLLDDEDPESGAPVTRLIVKLQSKLNS